MTAPTHCGPILIDTGVFAADMVRRSELAERFEPLIAGRPAFISFQTAAEVHYGALRRGWGEQRMRQLRAKLASVEVVYAGPDLVAVYARLRASARAPGTPFLSAITTPTGG